MSLLAAAGCAPYPEASPPSYDLGRTVQPAAGGTVHRVQRGETLWAISQRYGVTVDALARANRITSNQIEVGQRLTIPGDRGVTRAQPPSRSTVYSEPVRVGTGEKFVWPVQGKVISIFGSRWKGRVNKGIDIQARSGSEVRATRSGKVSFVHEGLPGFGKTIILEHAEGFASVYAYVGEILVRQGDIVAQRQVIARVGETGRTNVPALHFEIRRNQRAQNPLHYLP